MRGETNRSRAAYRAERLYEILAGAAAAGAACPTNDALCGRLGLDSNGSVSRLLQRLEAAGRIRTEITASRRRRVTIVASGRMTESAP